MNNVNISGFVKGSVKSSQFSDGSCFSKFTIQINEARNNKAYVAVAVWGKLAMFARDSLREDMLVQIAGKLSPRTETSEGVVHNYYEVIAYNITRVNPDLTTVSEKFEPITHTEPAST